VNGVDFPVFRVRDGNEDQVFAVGRKNRIEIVVGPDNKRKSFFLFQRVEVNV